MNILSKYKNKLNFFIKKNQIIKSNKNINYLKTSNLNDCGFLYIAFNKNFVQEAILSCESLRKNSKKKIAIFTDSKNENLKNFFDFVGIINPSNLRSKVDFISKSPFKKTIYLDSDTFVKNNIDDIFQILSKYDLAGCIDTARKRKNISDSIKEYSNIPYAFSEINGGVLAFKKNKRVKYFFQLWQKNFMKFYAQTLGWDQPSLRIALWKSNVNIHILPPEYNIRSKEIFKKLADKKKLGSEHMQDKILHMHYSNKIHKGEFKIKSLKKLEKIIEKKKIKITY